MVLEMSLRLVNILGQHYWSKSELNVWHALRQSLSVKYFVNIESEQWNYLSHIEETMNDFQISHLYFIAVLKYMRFLRALGRSEPCSTKYVTHVTVWIIVPHLCFKEWLKIKNPGADWIPRKVLFYKFFCFTKFHEVSYVENIVCQDCQLYKSVCAVWLV